MKSVRVIFEAIVDDDQIKDETDAQDDGFDCLEDAVSCDGLDALIMGSYEYTTEFEVLDLGED